MSSVEEIGEVMLDYFSNLFTTTNCEMDEVLECITSLLNPEANNRLLRPVSEEEVHRVVFQMHPNKSPGLDGLGTGFFLAFLGYCREQCGNVL